jgi:hypothetical protein
MIGEGAALGVAPSPTYTFASEGSYSTDLTQLPPEPLTILLVHRVAATIIFLSNPPQLRSLPLQQNYYRVK